MNRLEERLRDALDAAAETVRAESLAGLRVRPGVVRTRRLALLAAAAAVVVIVVGASVSTALVPAGKIHGQASSGGGRPSSAVSATFGPTKPMTASAYAVTMAIPQDWQPMPRVAPAVGYQGATGWVEVQSAQDSYGLHAACSSLVVGGLASPYPYGRHPQIIYRKFDGRPGCLVLAPSDAPQGGAQAGGARRQSGFLLVEYRTPIDGYNFLDVSVDCVRPLAIVDSIRLLPQAG